MQVTSYIELNNCIELEISDGINKHIHLLNKDYKVNIDIDNINIVNYGKIVENCILEGLYYKCINRISFRKRSVNYIKKYLSNELPDMKYVMYIINRLEATKYLDDRDYTKSYIKDMMYINKYGPARILNNLLKDEIEESIINDELRIYTYDLISKNIDFYISKYLKNNRDSYLMFKDKSINKLINKGYNIDDILNYFTNNDIVIYEEILIMNYLNSNKVDLVNLKERLIKRGFNSDKVAKVIEENKTKKTLL